MLAIRFARWPSSPMDAPNHTDSGAPLSPRHVAVLAGPQLLDDKVGPIPFVERSASPTNPKTDLIKSSSCTSTFADRDSSQELLPKMELPALRRNQSEPVLRRSIFRHYRSQEISEPNSDLTPQIQDIPPFRTTISPPSTQRKRSVSDGLDRFRSNPQRSSLQKHFSIPRNFQPSIRKHFLPLGDMVLGLDMEHILPSLPAPLQRFFRDGNNAALGGTYPLNAPRSILRQGSYRKKVESQSLPLEEATEHDEESESSFNLTQTFHLQSRSSRTVQFDPRVTVTEYEDDVERQWFSEQELEHFKCQTIALARRYLATEPGMMALYSKSRLDPVTGTMRKKALFSLPALRSTDETDLPERARRTCLEMRDMAESEVKNILIVDPNTVVLDLFRRSLQTIFPKARISVAESGEEALRVFRMAMLSPSRGTQRGFDVVIAEERLSPTRSDTRPNIQSGRSDSNLDGLSNQPELKKIVVKHESMSSLSCSSARSGMSGSGLLGTISEYEKTAVASESQSTNVQEPTEASPLVPAPERALLIGVSINPDVDATAFLDNGADFVWGKPPPLANGALRNQIVSALVQKRRYAHCSK
jgi:hypothetical protein